jgi:hypothetical protein
MAKSHLIGLLIFLGFEFFSEAISEKEGEGSDWGAQMFSSLSEKERRQQEKKAGSDFSFRLMRVRKMET